MFWFSRRKYNAAVDAALNGPYQIATHDNPDFPDVLAYLKLIDQGWNAKYSADETALFIALMYALGMMERGRTVEAEAIADRIGPIVRSRLASGHLSAEMCDTFRQLFEKAFGGDAPAKMA